MQPHSFLEELNISGFGSWTLDTKSQKMMINEEMHHLLGIHGQFDQTLSSFLTFLYPDDQARFKDALKKSIDNHSYFQLNCKVNPGNQFSTCLLIRGELVGTHEMRGAALDMTQFNTMLENITQAKEKAEEASRQKSEFLAKMTHDLRTPLNGIIGFAELMYHDKVGPLSTVHKEYLGDILTSARHLLVLINHILDLAKVEAGKMDFFPEEVDLSKIISETNYVFQALAAKKQIQFRTEIDPGLKKIVIDPSRLKQIIYNYVSNALKCTPVGGNVTLRFLPDGNNAFKLEVEDTGIGIRPEDMNKLFVEFTQLDRAIAKEYPSTGLGLALTRRIVEAQGGKVGAESTYGKGSKFYATLPRIYSQQ